MGKGIEAREGKEKRDIESTFYLFFQFMAKHQDVRLGIDYDRCLHGIAFTMDAYNVRKRIVIQLESLEELPFNFDLDSNMLKTLEDMYMEIAQYEGG